MDFVLSCCCSWAFESVTPSLMVVGFERIGCVFWSDSDESMRLRLRVEIGSEVSDRFAVGFDIVGFEQGRNFGGRKTVISNSSNGWSVRGRLIDKTS